MGIFISLSHARPTTPKMDACSRYRKNPAAGVFLLDSVRKPGTENSWAQHNKNLIVDQSNYCLAATIAIVMAQFSNQEQYGAVVPDTLAAPAPKTKFRRGAALALALLAAAAVASKSFQAMIPTELKSQVGGTTVSRRLATIDGCCEDDENCSVQCSSVAAACAAYNGSPVGEDFCVLDGGTRTASQIGPTCWGSSCYTSDTRRVCQNLGGETVNDLFCVLEGEYSQVGPTCYGSSCYTGATQSVCRNLGGSIIGDRFCVLEGTYTTVGPTCYGSTCYSLNKPKQYGLLRELGDMIHAPVCTV